MIVLFIREPLLVEWLPVWLLWTQTRFVWLQGYTNTVIIIGFVQIVSIENDEINAASKAHIQA